MELTTKLRLWRSRVMRSIVPRAIVEVVEAAASLSMWDSNLFPFCGHEGAARRYPSQADFDRLAKLAELFEISPRGWEEIRDELEPLTSELEFISAARRINDRLYLGFAFRKIPSITEPHNLREPEPITAADSAARYHGWRESMGLGPLVNYDVRPRAEEPLPLPFVDQFGLVLYRKIRLTWPLAKGRRRVIDDYDKEDSKR